MRHVLWDAYPVVMVPSRAPRLASSVQASLTGTTIFTCCAGAAERSRISTASWCIRPAWIRWTTPVAWSQGRCHVLGTVPAVPSGGRLGPVRPISVGEGAGSGACDRKVVGALSPRLRPGGPPPAFGRWGCPRRSQGEDPHPAARLGEARDAAEIDRTGPKRAGTLTGSPPASTAALSTSRWRRTMSGSLGLRTSRSAGAGRPGRHDQTRSNRSRFMTLSHAATKAFTNFSLASSLA